MARPLPETSDLPAHLRARRRWLGWAIWPFLFVATIGLALAKQHFGFEERVSRFLFWGIVGVALAAIFYRGFLGANEAAARWRHIEAEGDGPVKLDDPAYKPMFWRSRNGAGASIVTLGLVFFAATLFAQFFAPAIEFEYLPVVVLLGVAAFGAGRLVLKKMRAR
jgi:hypothetical protein